MNTAIESTAILAGAFVALAFAVLFDAAIRGVLGWLLL